MNRRKEERSRGGESYTGFRSWPTSNHTKDTGMNRLQTGDSFFPAGHPADAMAQGFRRGTGDGVTGE